ncbi:MAG TPA: hypothetical protein P5079_11530, partial [Elusimicrobiota bacterium]|nr:hypothetical protein [Elusimicrobiota bacterium]
IAISELKGTMDFLNGREVVFRDREGKEYTRVDLVELAGTPGGAEAAAILGWYAGLALNAKVNSDGTVTLNIGGEIPVKVNLDTFLQTQVAISELAGAKAYLDDKTIVFRDRNGREFSRVDLLTAAGELTPEGVKAAAILGWYGGLALHASVNPDGTVTLKITDEKGRSLPTPKSVDLDTFLKTQVAISQLGGAMKFLDDGTVVYYDRTGKAYTRVDLLAEAGQGTPAAAQAAAILGWYAGLALSSTVTPEGKVMMTIGGKTPMEVDLDTFLRTQAAISELAGAQAFLDGNTVVFRDRNGREYSRVDLLTEAGQTTPEGIKAAAILGWYGGLALQSEIRDGKVFLHITDAEGNKLSVPESVDLDTFLKVQAAISELPGAQKFLDDGVVVFKDKTGREFTRVDLLELAGTKEGATAAAILGWYAGLALSSRVNADGTVSLTIGGEVPVEVDLDTFLATQAAISELAGAKAYLDANTIVFVDAQGKEYSRVDLLGDAGNATPAGARAAAILGWYAGLALHSEIKDGKVILNITDADGNSLETPAEVDLDTFLKIQAAISELGGAKEFLDDGTVVFKDRNGKEFTRVDLVTLAGTPEGAKAAAILGWYAGLALNSKVNEDGTVTLTIGGTVPVSVDLDTFLRTQVAISELAGAKAYLDDKTIVFVDREGKEYSRVDLLTASGQLGPEGVKAAAILGWYAGMALHSSVTADGRVILQLTDENGNQLPTPATVDLDTFLKVQIAISELSWAKKYLDDGTVVFYSKDGKGYSRVDLVALAGSGTPEGTLAAAVLGWYAGLALRVEATATGLVIHFYKDKDGDGQADEGEEIATPQSIDLNQFLR